MAKRKNSPQPAEEPSVPSTGKPSFTDQLREDLAALTSRLELMEKVQEIIKTIMKGPGRDMEKKIANIIFELYNLGMTDEQVAYVVEQKPGQDGNYYMGYTFAEVNNVRTNIQSKKAQINHIENRSHTAALEERQQDSDLPPLPGS
ncbi:MAG: hypothetical protein R3B84_20425 [Zavarzinella sp.]